MLVDWCVYGSVPEASNEPSFKDTNSQSLTEEYLGIQQGVITSFGLLTLGYYRCWV